MKEPRAWKMFGEQIHQDFLLDHPDMFEGFARIAGTMNRGDRADLVDYLKYLTGPAVSRAEQMQSWLNSGSNLFVVKAQITKFLLYLLSVIQEIKGGGGN